ncbi:MAG: cytochrome c oxidase subunit II [Planctomycetota bacterium]
MFAIQDPQTPPQITENTDAWGQLFRLRSTFGAVDDLYYFTLLVCIFFFLLITGILLYSVVKYRRKSIDQPPASSATHNTLLEVVWTVIPLIIVMVIFAWGWSGSFEMTYAPRNARKYTANASQWSWTFQYPNDPATSTNELWLEVGKPALFHLISKDVLHAFYIPSMRVKRDVVPGRINTVWFQPTTIGDYHLFCAEYCGKDHSQMRAIVHVVSPAKYKTRPWDTWDPNDMPGNGERIYKTQCASCHSIDGSRLVGPSWKGLFIKQPDGSYKGKEERLADGTTVTIDRDYVLESVRTPNAKIVDTFAAGQMTAFDETLLPEYKIDAIVAFMQKLAEN